MTNIDFQTIESSYTLPHDITHETWFITRKGLLSSLAPIRRELYKAEDGSVVAIRDSGIGVDTALYVDEEYFTFFKDEPELEVIMNDQGITAYSKIKLFRMEES